MKIILIALLLICPLFVRSQTETTNALLKKMDGNGMMSLYFYKNTLKMLNQNDDKDFDEMIKNIEKLRFMMLTKSKSDFDAADYKKLLKGYQSESYEEILTTRMDGRNFDVYLKDKKGSSLGTIILVNDSSTLYVMDMIGTIDLTKATSLFSKLDQSTEIGSKIKNFLGKDDKDKTVGKKHEMHIE